MSGPLTSNNLPPTSATNVSPFGFLEVQRRVLAGEPSRPPEVRRLRAVPESDILKDLDHLPKGTPAPRLAPKWPAAELEPALPPVALTASPRMAPHLLALTLVRRCASLALDALLITLFSPLIAGWLMVERRRRRTPGI